MNKKTPKRPQRRSQSKQKVAKGKTKKGQKQLLKLTDRATDTNQRTRKSAPRTNTPKQRHKGGKKDAQMIQ